jgi:hypothetical protein
MAHAYFGDAHHPRPCLGLCRASWLRAESRTPPFPLGHAFEMSPAQDGAAPRRAVLLLFTAFKYSALLSKKSLSECCFLGKSFTDCGRSVALSLWTSDPSQNVFGLEHRDFFFSLISYSHSATTHSRSHYPPFPPTQLYYTHGFGLRGRVCRFLHSIATLFALYLAMHVAIGAPSRGRRIFPIFFFCVRASLRCEIN